MPLLYHLGVESHYSSYFSLSHLCVSQSGCPGKPRADQLRSPWAANPGTSSSCCAHKPPRDDSSSGSTSWLSHSGSIHTSPTVSTAVLYMLMQNSTDFLWFFIFKVYTNLSYLWTNTAPFSLILVWQWFCSDAKINFPSQEKDPSYNE